MLTAVCPEIDHFRAAPSAFSSQPNDNGSWFASGKLFRGRGAAIRGAISHNQRSNAFRENKGLLHLAVLVVLVGIFFSPSLFRGASVYDVDLRHVQTPIKWFQFQEKGGAFFPLWTDRIGCGYPIHAYGEGGLLYPLNGLVYPLFPSPLAHDITLMVHLLIAGAGMLFLGSRYHQNSTASLVSAVCFMFSGYMCVHMGHLDSVQVCAWIPWAFVAMDKNRDSFRPISIIGLGICIAMMLLAGRPQIVFYAWVMLAFHATANGINRPYSARFLLVLAGGTVLGVCMAAPQILPTLEFASLSDRSKGLAYANQLLGAVSWSQLVWIVAPLWHRGDTFGVAAESIGYVGITGGALLICSFLAAGRGYFVEWWVLLVVCLLLAMGNAFPPNSWVYQLPGLSYFRCHARWLSMSTFAAAVLMGYGADAVLGVVKDPRRRRVLGFLLALIVFTDLYTFLRPSISFVDRRAQDAVPQAVSALQRGGRYFCNQSLPIFTMELNEKGIEPEHYPEYFSSRETLNANLGMRYGLEIVDVYAGLHLPWSDRALKRITPSLLSRMSCEFIVTQEAIPLPGLKQVWRNPHFRIYRNERVEPRARLVPSLVPAGKEGFVSVGTLGGSARILDDGTEQKVLIDVNAEKAGFLILADTYYPGWRVRVNGEEARLYRANDWMRGVPVPSGRSRVEFRYRPNSFYMGLGVAAAACLVVILAAVGRRCGRRREGSS